MKESLFAVILVLLALASFAFNEQPQRKKAEMIVRGKYLVTVPGCDDCHSPKLFTPMGPVPDTTRLLWAHPATSTLPEVLQDVLARYLQLPKIV